MRHSTKRTRKQSRGRSRRQRQQGGAIFTTEEKDNLVNNGGFTYEHLDYLGSLPNDFRRLFGSFERNDYNFIKAWQMSVSDLYDIPPTAENMKQLAEKTIEDFKYFFERRSNPQFAQNDAPEQDTSSVNLDTNISSVSFGGSKKRKYTRRRSNKKH
jgi:hypothetical protein